MDCPNSSFLFIQNIVFITVVLLVIVLHTLVELSTGHQTASVHLWYAVCILCPAWSNNLAYQ